MDDFTFALGVWFLLGHLLGLIAMDQAARAAKEREDQQYEWITLDEEDVDRMHEMIFQWSEYDHQWRNKQCAENLMRSYIARGMSRCAQGRVELAA